MKKLFIALAAIIMMVIAVSPPLALAQGVTRVTGGGTGTFNADLDGDGDTDGSQFGLGVNISDTGSAKGHFECLMAGSSDILGLPLMAVEGKVNSGSVKPDGSATLGGLARVDLGNGTIFDGVSFAVTVTEGGPEVGTLILTMIGAFDGVPGDTINGNGNYDLPVETVTSGRINIH